MKPTRITKYQRVSYKIPPCHSYLWPSYCHVYEIGLANWIIDLLKMVTTSNYNSLTGLHTLKITVTAADIKSSISSLVVSWQRILTMSSANVLTGWRISHNWLIASTFYSSLHWLINCSSQLVPFITLWHGRHRKHRSLLYFNCCRGTCLFAKPLLSNGCRIFAYSVTIA
jgi:hypothetical protein